MAKYNKTKNHGSREAWMREKKANRLKQVWVWDNEAKKIGHWEHFSV